MDSGVSLSASSVSSGTDSTTSDIEHLHLHASIRSFPLQGVRAWTSHLIPPRHISPGHSLRATLVWLDFTPQGARVKSIVVLRRSCARRLPRGVVEVGRTPPP